MPAPPDKSEISAPYPNPSNAVMRLGMSRLYDYVVGLLGLTGSPASARAALGAFSSSGGNFDGAINERRAVVPSHPTNADIWGALGNSISFTGAAVVESFPNAPQAGAKRWLHCAAACKFKHSAALNLPGAVDFQAAADDLVIIEAISVNTFRAFIHRSSGLSVIGSSSALPTMSVITATGTYTKKAGCKYIRVRLVGGGGGGGTGAGGGGGGGGGSEKVIDMSSITTVSVTIGAGGGANAAGTTTSFGSHCTATGGLAGGAISQNASSYGGNGGVGSGGDFNASGQCGGGGSSTLNVYPNFAAGGSSMLGGGSFLSGSVIGYGGGGGSSSPGANGVVIVEEFY